MAAMYINKLNPEALAKQADMKVDILSCTDDKYIYQCAQINSWNIGIYQ